MGLYRAIADAMSRAQQNVLRLGDRVLYRVFEKYYSLRELVSARVRANQEPDSKPLRNPVHRLVEFYVDHVWPGTELETALPLVMGRSPKAEAVKAAILKVWEWSNWSSRKSRAIRTFAMNGDLFLKIVARKPTFAVGGDVERVSFQIIEAAYVTDFDVDDRHVVTYIRVDIPKTRRLENGTEEPYTHTEIWNASGMRVWEHTQGEQVPYESLGEPMQSMTLDEVGTPGMLPFVWSPFRDAGDERGHNAFWAAIEKIDEASNLATRLHRDLFRSGPVWAVESAATDASGRPVPPPKFSQDGALASTSVELSGEKMLGVPGSLKCLIPNVNFEAMLAILNAQMDDILEDLPELQYYRVMHKSQQLATATVRLMLAPAVARVLEARANAEHALVRADKIALTMAQNMNLPGFSVAELGTYDAGDFEHGFESRDVLPLTDEEKAATEKAQAEADRARVDLGIPLTVVLRERGYSEEEIDQFAVLRSEEQAERQTMADMLMDATMRRFDQGAER